MSIIQVTSEQSEFDSLRCPNCDAVLPSHATFCSTCGTRIEQDFESIPPESDIAEGYRITSLIRRSPYVQLLLGYEKQSQQPVVIRDIDITILQDDARTQAMEAWSREYKLLCGQKVPDVMPLIDLRHFQGHLFSIAKWPFSMEQSTQRRSYTLEDLLQSGIGLPDEQTAVMWISHVCQAVARLHALHIVIGNLDPRALIVSETSYSGSLALMVSWLPASLRAVLPHQSTKTTAPHFSAPEALVGTVEPISDVYSLGALLYLLLTGIAPENPKQQKRRPLHSPRNLNTRISSELDAIVMQALSLEISARFQSAEQMAVALQSLSNATRSLRAPKNPGGKNRRKREPLDDAASEATIRITPLRDQLARFQQSKFLAGKLKPQKVKVEEEVAEDGVPTMRLADFPLEELPKVSPTLASTSEASPTQRETQFPERISEQTATETSKELQHDVEDVSSVVELPLEERETQHISGASTAESPETATDAPPTSPSKELVPRQSRTDIALPPPPKIEMGILLRLQRFILGEQASIVKSAALIETPLRIQPEQPYAIRIHIMGRDEPGKANAGLSRLVLGKIIRVEVRSALYQSYAYVVQQANIQIPGKGYAAEINMPMRPLLNGPNGRRERLHILFMDEYRNPLYEKPFVIELLISHLVKPGREGHNVLSIPL